MLLTTLFVMQFRISYLLQFVSYPALRLHRLLDIVNHYSQIAILAMFTELTRI